MSVTRAKPEEMKTATAILTVLLFAAAAAPAFAQEAPVSVSIMGGSEASQPCVSSKTCYEPDAVTIVQRTEVFWTNNDTTAHTVTSGEPSANDAGSVFDSGDIGPEGTYSFIFMSPGTYNYFCTIHPWMTGQIVVTSSATPGATTPEFGPAAMLVFSVSVVFASFLARGRLG